MNFITKPCLPTGREVSGTKANFRFRASAGKIGFNIRYFSDDNTYTYNNKFSPL